MTAILSALVPIMAIIALGRLMDQRGALSEAAWAGLDRVTYYLFFPSLIFYQLARADAGDRALSLAGALISAQGIMAASLLIARRRLPLDGPAFSSVFQGAVRWNSFVALALAESLHDREGLTLVTIGVAVMVPVANVLSVHVLVRHAQGGAKGPGATALLLLRNPLVLACVAGVASHALPAVPGAVLDTARLLGAPTLPLGLLTVGAGIDLMAARRAGTVVLGASALKLLGMPALVFLTCALFGVEGVAREAAVMCGAVPAATMSYLLARQMDGDAPLMAGIITATTLASLATMPLVLALARA